LAACLVARGAVSRAYDCVPHEARPHCFRRRGVDPQGIPPVSPGRGEGPARSGHVDTHQRRVSLRAMADRSGSRKL
ncbi:MAG: hypothetical protein KJ060_13795, partial [Candidatus Hydrogenedentes bacterium]|nr:hypothetical protein [Candidatus Hydrogenedentota bacterium]